MKRDIALKIVAGLVGAVVKSEDGLIAAAATSPHLESPLRGEGTEPAGERDGLHQSRFLSHDVRSRPDYFPGNEYFGLQIFFGRLRPSSPGERNRDVERLILVIGPESVFNNVFNGLRR